MIDQYAGLQRNAVFSVLQKNRRPALVGLAVVVRAKSC
jgi:hypothetical protein